GPLPPLQGGAQGPALLAAELRRGASHRPLAATRPPIRRLFPLEALGPFARARRQRRRPHSSDRRTARALRTAWRACRTRGGRPPFGRDLAPAGIARRESPQRRTTASSSRSN